MTHFGSTGIGSLRNQRDSEDLMAVIAHNLPRILIGIFNVFFFFPK